MFIYDLFEDAQKRVVVTYPGRFQPFHKGHAEVFANLQRKFGSDNVFIVTSNKTDGGKSPFNFSDKVHFMHAMGIPDHQIIETDKVYELPPQFASIKDQVVFITVVGAPDEKRLNPGSTKKDGNPSYFQRMPSSANELRSAEEHGYVIVEPEHPENISIGGKTYDVSHGTPCRELWNQVRDNPQQRAEFVQQLYGKADAGLANILDKIPTGAPEPAPKPSPKLKAVKQPKQEKQPKQDVGAELNEFAPPGSGDGDDGFSDETLKRLAAQWWQGDEDPRIERVLMSAGWEIGRDEGYDNGGAFVVMSGDENGNSYMSWPAEELEGLSEDAAGVGVIANKKQKNDPRYSMSMTQDVGPGEDKKNMKKLHLEGYGSNRGYNYGFASPTAPSLGRRGREDDEYHVPDPTPSTWYIRANGKIIKDKMGTPYQYRDKETARKAAMTMMSKPFNAGKKFMLTTRPEDETPAPVAENTGPVTHRIGLTVTDPNHPMVSKRGETYQKSVRITQDVPDREAAINQAIAHYRRKGYKVHDHHYIGTVDNEPMAETIGGATETQVYQYLIQQAPEFMKTAPSANVKQAITKAMSFGSQLSVQDLASYAYGMLKTNDLSEGAELKQAKRKYNQAAKDANLDQVGAGKKIDTMKKSLRQKDLDNKKEVEEIDEGDTGARPGWMLKQDPELAKKVKDSKAGHQALKKWAGKPVPKDDKPGVAEGWDPDTTRLEQDVRDALENGDDYTAKQYAKMAPTPEAKKYLLNIIKQAMYIDDLGGETDWKGVAEGGIATVGWPDEGNHTGNNPPVSIGGVSMPQLSVGDQVKYFGSKATVVGLSQDRKRARIHMPERNITQNVDTADLTRLGRGDYANKKPLPRVAENAEELHVGDPVIITGDVEFKGKTGDIDSFGDMKRFVVVNLYNYGKHSFHSSDVSSNEYVDPNEIDEDMYQYNREDPYNSEFAPRAGMGRMTLRGWKQQMIKRTAELAQQMADAGQDIDKAALWDHVYKKLKSMNMDPIAQEIEQAQAELEKIRQRGGVRSRAFNR